MSTEREQSSIDRLNKLAEILRDLQQLTVNLLSVCSAEQPDSRELADLLSRRQQLITQAAALELTVAAQTDLLRREGEQDLAILKKLGEIRLMLEQTALLDSRAKTALAAKRDRLKAELARLRVGRAAGKVYNAKAPQEEGFFLDRREN